MLVVLSVKKACNGYLPKKTYSLVHRPPGMIYKRESWTLRLSKQAAKGMWVWEGAGRGINLIAVKLDTKFRPKLQ